MLRSGNQIRLTPSEIDLFTTITGFVPENVKTVGDLDTYVKRCKEFYWGTSRHTRFLRWLIDDTRAECFGGGR
jgi:hypothetical protein